MGGTKYGDEWTTTCSCLVERECGFLADVSDVRCMHRRLLDVILNTFENDSFPHEYLNKEVNEWGGFMVIFTIVMIAMGGFH